ncbi:MAG: GTP pyrophosphokinase family protein [Clostridium sp.]|nr:GTP pyrophosphokinase family protein [Clostridium sp.]
MELMMMYRGAIREIQTKLEVLNDEFSTRYQRNPISFIKSRIKSPESIIKKLHTRGYGISLESITENLHDVAGIRVICSFIDDIYEVAQMLTKQDDVTLLETKDYIQNPKPNGYRSLHLILEVPVFFSDRKQPMKVEVQIRTIAMDFWASLDHQLRYKRDIENASQISEDLKDCADIISATDQRMQIIKYQIYGDESGNFMN